MVNHETNEVFFDNFEVPAENLIGEEGKGFRYILDGMNAERILIAAECIGDGYWFIDRARRYANERVVFDRPIGQNQGVQFPIARAYANVRAADLMRYEAARLFDAGQPVRRRSEHGEAAGRRRVVGGGQRLPADPRRLRLRRGVRCRAQVPRDAPLPGRAGLDEPDPVVHRRARARHAEVVLMDSSLPFAGMRVVALEQAVAAPFCSRQLADLGADVIKVERPDGGDFARGYDDALHGVSAYFAWLNRGKRSIVLDLKQPAGLDVFGAPARARRRLRAQSRARRGRAPGLRLRRLSPSAIRG